MTVPLPLPVTLSATLIHSGGGRGSPKHVVAIHVNGVVSVMVPVVDWRPENTSAVMMLLTLSLKAKGVLMTGISPFRGGHASINGLLDPL